MGLDQPRLVPVKGLELWVWTCTGWRRWWWRPLAGFLTSRFPEQTQGCQCWQSNDGDGLDAEESAALAVVLGAELESGAVARFAVEYAAELEGLPSTPCRFCGASGEREWPDGRRTCNGCGGSGQEAAWETSYPFSEENVREFHAFLAACGGFEIW